MKHNVFSVILITQLPECRRRFIKSLISVVNSRWSYHQERNPLSKRHLGVVLFLRCACSLIPLPAVFAICESFACFVCPCGVEVAARQHRALLGVHETCQLFLLLLCVDVVLIADGRSRSGTRVLSSIYFLIITQGSLEHYLLSIACFVELILFIRTLVYFTLLEKSYLASSEMIRLLYQVSVSQRTRRLLHIHTNRFSHHIIMSYLD